MQLCNMSVVILVQLMFIVFHFNTAIVCATDSELESCSNTCLQTWTRLYKSEQGIYYCGCGDSVLEGEPHCNFLKIVTVQTDYCVTIDEACNISYIGTCPYNSLLFHQYSTNVRLPRDALSLNNFVCNVSNFTRHHYFCGQQRRRGILCSKCEDGHGPAVMSYTQPCVECKWYGWLLYITLSFVPATVLCLFIIIFRVNVLSPPLNAIVLLCHVMASHVNYKPCQFFFSTDANHFPPSIVIFILTVYGFSNMDFFVYVVPPFCISNKMSTLTVIALEYTISLYPLALSALIYLLIEVHDRGCMLLVWVWRPFHSYLVRFRRTWDVKGSIINAFATLYVLSFTKVITTSVNLMLTTVAVNIYSEHTYTRLYYNASCILFQSCHRPYAILAIAVTVMFSILPSLFIFLHSLKLLRKCFQCHKCTLANEIAKIFQHSFKDGTDSGTIDCRWFAGIYLFIRLVIATSVNFRTVQQIQVIGSLTGLLLVALFQPHTCAYFNVIDSFLFGWLGVAFVLMSAGQRHHIAQVLIFLSPLLTIIILILYKMVQKYGKKSEPYLYRLQHLCCFMFKQSTDGSSQSGVVTQENEPLIDNDKPEVLYTVVDVKEH